MAVALVDHVCIYHILHGEFRKFHTIEIKYVKKVRFSSGGQILVVADHKKMFFFNTFSLEKIKDMACPSQNISNLAFNPDDSEMVFISSDGMVQTFDLIDWTKKSDTASIQRNFVYSGAFFMQEGESKVAGQSYWRILTAGLEKEVGGSLKVFSSLTGDFEKPTFTFNDLIESDKAQ